MPTLTLRLLGGLEIEQDEQPIDSLKTTKAQALLVYLAVSGRAHTRHELAGLFWSEDSEDKAKNSLRVALANLNKEVPGYIESDRLTVTFRRNQPHRVDALEFDALTQNISADSSIAVMQMAVALYEGDFLHDFYVEGAPEFEVWQLNAREHYRQVALTLLEQLGNALIAARRYVEAIEAFGRLVKLEPWYEAAHRHLMLAYSRTGNFSRALAQYEQCRTALEAELGVSPMPETDALYARIRAAREHRAAPLPVEPAPFIGREAELAEIGRLLLQRGCRLVTVVGLGGSGKTRLAVEAARRANTEQAVEFLNGVHFVPLPEVGTVDAIAPALVEVLAITGGGQSRPRRQLVDYLQGKEMLLVLDNFEHLQQGVQQLVEILAHAPGVKMLVTSREPLQVEQEWRVVMDGMTYPSRPEDDGFASYDAVQLFVQAARQVQPDFAVTDSNRHDIWRLCRAVEGMPLALTLAAPWLRATDIAAIVQEVETGLEILASELRNIPARQRSLRVVCEHSWQLLARRERELLASLAVFRGGCTLEAAHAVAGATLAQMAALVDRSFVRHSRDSSGDHRSAKSRYTLHELIRQFANGKLAEIDVGIATLAAAHSRYFAEWVQTCYSRYLAGKFPQVIADLAVERDNVRAAWFWLVERVRDDAAAAEDAGCLETLARFALVLAWSSRKSTHHLEGLELLEAASQALALAQEAAEAHTELQRILDGVAARLQIYRATLLYYTGAYVETQQRIEDALPLVHAAGWVADEALALDTLAKCVRRRGDYAAAKTLAARTKALYASINDEVGRMQGVVAVAVVAADEGDYVLAEAAGQEAIDFYAQLNDTASLTLTQSNLANTFIRQEKYAAAQPLLEGAYARASAEGNLFSLMMTATNLAAVADGIGDDAQAERYAREALARAREIGDRRWSAVNLNRLSRIAIRKGAWQIAEDNAQAALALTRAIPSEIDIMSDLSCLAQTWARRGKLEPALRLLAFVADHPSTTQVDKMKNAALLQELQAELQPTIVTAVDAWCATLSLDDLLRWVDIAQHKTSSIE